MYGRLSLVIVQCSMRNGKSDHLFSCPFPLFTCFCLSSSALSNLFKDNAVKNTVDKTAAAKIARPKMLFIDAIWRRGYNVVKYGWILFGKKIAGYGKL